MLYRRVTVENNVKVLPLIPSDRMLRHSNLKLCARLHLLKYHIACHRVMLNIKWSPFFENTRKMHVVTFLKRVIIRWLNFTVWIKYKNTVILSGQLWYFETYSTDYWSNGLVNTPWYTQAIYFSRRCRLPEDDLQLNGRNIPFCK
jgi:hypothetical protein